MPAKLLLRSRLAHVELGRPVTDADYDVLATGEVDIFKPDGARLCSVRRGVISPENREAARQVLRPLRSQKTSNRGKASGGETVNRVKRDGTRSSTNNSTVAVASSIIGYFDRYTRIPYCRQTAFNAQQAAAFDELRPALAELADAFSRTVPDRWAAQMGKVNKTSSDFVIAGTPWTTITVNHNWSTCTHTDKGDLDEGFSCLTVLRYGDYTGAHLVFPAFRVAVDLHDGDMIMMDSHEIHANTCLVPSDPSAEAERISLVLYYRTRMVECGSAAQELERAKSLRGSIVAEDALDDG